MEIPTHISDPIDIYESIKVGIITTLICTICHYLSYYKLSKKYENKELGARVISFIHSVISTIFSAYAIYHHQGGKLDSPATRLEANCQMLSLAYFVVDTFFMIFIHFDIMFLIHHLIAITMLSCGGIFGIYGYILCLALLVGEISNPFLHLRWIVNIMAPNSSIFKICTNLWFGVFFITRVILCPYIFIRGMYIVHWLFLPQSFGMILFSGIFLYDVYKKEKNGEIWIG
jgi:TLC domain